MTIEVPVYDLQGAEVGKRALPAGLFEVEASTVLMHQALVRQQANARLASAQTKTRSEVRGGGRKPWRQKGTGRARQGSIRAPQWRGGGIVHGPTNRRNFTKEMPRKMRRLALKSALSVKAREGQVRLLQGTDGLEAPRTRTVAGLLQRLGLEGSALFLVAADEKALLKSVSNLPRNKALRAEYLNVRDLLGYDYLLVSLPALERMEALWGAS